MSHSDVPADLRSRVAEALRAVETQRLPGLYGPASEWFPDADAAVSAVLEGQPEADRLCDEIAEQHRRWAAFGENPVGPSFESFLAQALLSRFHLVPREGGEQR